jgi:hypothetical protein
MTKRQKMILSYLRWEQRQSQFDTHHRITVSWRGVTLRFKNPPADVGKRREIQRYLQKVMEQVHDEALRKTMEIMTIGCSTSPEPPYGRGPDDLTSADTNPELTSTDIN